METLKQYSELYSVEVFIITILSEEIVIPYLDLKLRSIEDKLSSEAHRCLKMISIICTLSMESGTC